MHHWSLGVFNDDVRETACVFFKVFSSAISKIR